MDDTIGYLNTDLDLTSAEDLTVLAAAFEAEGAKQRSVDGVNTREHPLADQIEADKDLASKQAMGSKSLGVRPAKIVRPGGPPGAREPRRRADDRRSVRSAVHQREALARPSSWACESSRPSCGVMSGATPTIESPTASGC